MFDLICTRLNTFYHFDSLRFYKEKFVPAFTEETFFVWWPRGLRRPRLIFAVARALDPEGIPATLLRPHQTIPQTPGERTGEKRRDAKNAEDAEKNTGL